MAAGELRATSSLPCSAYGFAGPGGIAPALPPPGCAEPRVRSAPAAGTRQCHVFHDKWGCVNVFCKASAENRAPCDPRQPHLAAGKTRSLLPSPPGSRDAPSPRPRVPPSPAPAPGHCPHPDGCPSEAGPGVRGRARCPTGAGGPGRQLAPLLCKQESRRMKIARRQEAALSWLRAPSSHPPPAARWLCAAPRGPGPLPDKAEPPPPHGSGSAPGLGVLLDMSPFDPSSPVPCSPVPRGDAEPCGCAGGGDVRGGSVVPQPRCPLPAPPRHPPSRSTTSRRFSRASAKRATSVSSWEMSSTSMKRLSPPSMGL